MKAKPRRHTLRVPVLPSFKVTAAVRDSVARARRKGGRRESDKFLLAFWLPKGKRPFGLCHCNEQCAADYVRDSLGYGIPRREVVARWRGLGLLRAKPFCVTGRCTKRHRCFVFSYRMKARPFA